MDIKTIDKHVDNIMVQVNRYFDHVKNKNVNLELSKIENAWLVNAHRLCNELDIPDGEINWRLNEGIKVVGAIKGNLKMVNLMGDNNNGT